MARFPRITVLGAGAWGVALANLVARGGNDVILWARDAGHVAEMTATRESRRLPGVKLATTVRPEISLAAAAACDLLLCVVPAQATREIVGALAGLLPASAPVVLCSKGIERVGAKFLSEVVDELLPSNPAAVLSGPSFAADVSRGLPTAVTLACAREPLAAEIANALASPTFRLYHTGDVRGVEIGGAAKNVLAIACGITHGRDLGASAGAALLARGFAELTRFGLALGARPETLMGLSGLGDLVLTCTSAQSRNFSYGVALGRGEPPAQAAGGKLAEGALTGPVLVALARKHGVDMPICQAVSAIVAGDLSVDDAIGALLARPTRGEG